MQAANRSVPQAFAFERFLKLYHLLELVFDYDLVQEIQGLGADIKGVGRLLNDYERLEQERLKAVISRKCANTTNEISQLELCLNRVRMFLPVAKEIFYAYGKDKNPLRDEPKFDSLIAAGGFTEALARTQNLIKTNNDYQKLILDVCAYWIYRVRCCIAHYRIGEYMIDDSQEDFIVEFAEQLLREVLCQRFK